jgi:hypothetical protein
MDLLRLDTSLCSIPVAHDDDLQSAGHLLSHHSQDEPVRARQKAHSLPGTASGWTRLGVKLLYAALLLLIAAFLYRLGAEPWKIALMNWPVLLGVMFTTGVGLVVQAQSFRAVAPTKTTLPGLRLVTQIWSVAAISSVVAPLFAGIATRTVLLVRAGMPIGDCLTTSGRQFWLGIETSLLLGAISVPMTPFPAARGVGIALATIWAVLLVARWLSARGVSPNFTGDTSVRALLQALRGKVDKAAYPWFALQALTMSATYFLAFNGMGANLSIVESVALASITVMLSILIFVPNGLGINDTVWIYFATHAGLSLEASVAIALTMRIAHFIASILVYLSTRTAEPGL